MRSTDLRAVAIAAACTLAALPSFAQVAQGPLVQAVTASQGGIWVRTTVAQPVRIRVIAPDGTQTYTSPKTTAAASDFTASFMVTGLQPGSVYQYQVGTTDTHGVETFTGKYAFDTVAVEPAKIDIAVLSDFANKLVASPSLHTALAAHPDMLAVIGDLDHRGPAGAAHPTVDYDPVEILADMRSMHRDTRDPATPLGADFASGLIGKADSGVAQVPFVYAWDDHDFCDNNAGKSCPAAKLSFQALNEYYILAPDNWQSNGCAYPADFESLSYGTLAQVFVLDARSNRVKVTPTGANTTLGACQLNWLETQLHASKAQWKVVLTPVPMNETIKTWDAWGFFHDERAALLAAIADVPNVVFVSGDVHTGGAVDDGTHSGRPEIATPHANMPRSWVNTYCRLIDLFTVLQVRPGSWTFGSATNPIVDHEPLECGSNTYPDGFPVDNLPAPVYALDGRDNPGYVWIEATRASLQLTVRDSAGNVKQGVDAAGHANALGLMFTAAH